MATYFPSVSPPFPSESPMFDINPPDSRTPPPSAPPWPRQSPPTSSDHRQNNGKKISSRAAAGGLPSTSSDHVASHSVVNAARFAPGPWSTGLCGCCTDFSTCCLTCWFPCITFGRIAEIVDRGSTSCGVSGGIYGLVTCMTACACNWVYSSFYRSKLRGQYFLDQSPCADCCVHCCCHHCALCQEYRELQNQGFHMPIGWHGNVERKSKVDTAPPLVQKGMKR